MISFCIAVFIAGLGALAVHEVTWLLRRRALKFLSLAGVLSVAVYTLSVSYFLFSVLFMSGWGDDSSRTRSFALLSLTGVVVLSSGVLIGMIFIVGRLQKEQIPTSLWPSIWCLCAETGLAVFTYFFLRGHWGGEFIRSYLEDLQYAWFAYGFDYFAWNWWFENLFVSFWLLLAVTRPLHEKVNNKILQSYPDSFRLK